MEAQELEEGSAYRKRTAMFQISCVTLAKRYGTCKVAGLMAQACEVFIARCERKSIVRCLVELSFVMPERGGAQFLPWIGHYLHHQNRHVRFHAVRVLECASTSADGVFAQPLLDLMSSDPHIEVRREAASCLLRIWRGKAPRAAIPSILPLLRARRERDLAFFPELDLDEYAWLMGSCFEMLAHASQDAEIQSEMATFFASEIDWLFARDARDPPTQDLRMYQIGVLGACLKALKPNGGQRMYPHHLRSIVRAFNGSEHARKDLYLKRAICALDPRNDALAKDVRRPGRPGPHRRASIAAGQRRIEDYFGRAA